MSPLHVTALGSALCADVLVFPLLGIALIAAPLSLLTIASAVGILVVGASTHATRALLDRSFRAA